MSFCERCGRSARPLTLCNIEGARMYVCTECVRYGKPIPVNPQPVQSPVQSMKPRTASPRKDALATRELELAEDYPQRIQRAREKLGLSREDLGKRINEKVSIISKLETGTMHPSDELVKKLESALSIILLEPVQNVESSSAAESAGMTLGDFITRKNR